MHGVWPRICGSTLPSWRTARPGGWRRLLRRKVQSCWWPSPLLFHDGRTFITQSLCTNQSSVVKLLMAGFIIYLQKETFIPLPLRCICCFLHFLSPQGTAVGQEHLHMGRVVVEENVFLSVLWSFGKPRFPGANELWYYGMRELRSMKWTGSKCS